MSITAILGGAKELQATLGEDEVLTAEMGSEGFLAKDGGFYTPSVSNVDEGTIEFAFAASEEGMPEVPEVQVPLPEGPAGYTPQKGKDYFDGKDGYTPQKGIDYFDGQDGYTPVKGVDYFDGKDGYTPVKGKDYVDGKDGTSVTVSGVMESMDDGGINTVFFSDGKSLEVRNGKAGYTPQKGKDYFDGQPGKDGVSPVIEVNNIDGGYGLNIKDASGTKGFFVMNGLPGEPGYTPQKGVDYFDGEDGYTPQKGVDYFDGQPGKDGTSVTVSGVMESVDDGGVNAVFFSDGKSLEVRNGKKGSDASVTTASITNALGYKPMNPGEYAVSVKVLGAKGDNSTDDTAAFQSALANYRTVYVPGGKYKLSGELVIESNCQLELSQDAVLYFTQTAGNCISMKMSANIVGNHATVSVPYTFSGNVINIDSELNTSVSDIPPFTKWDPMWKTGRFITALNIVKPDTRGFYYSMDGTCNGVAVYLRANYNVPSTTSSYIWATNLSTLRIGGAFKYGIFAESFKSEVTDSSGWIHQLKVDGFIDGPEVGLYLKDIEHTYASVLFLPRRAYTTDGKYIPYAKWGICLENSTNTNLLGSRVMDWNSTYSLWAPGNMYQHIALLGNCRDVKLDDFLYYGNPSYDIRDLIYTDTPSNLDSVSILEEPITRWFKPVDGTPYFNDGFTEKRLMLREELDDLASLERIANFTNKVPTAINLDGSVFYNKGYVQEGARWNGSDGSLITTATYYGCVGLIPVKPGDIIRAKNLSYNHVEDSNANIVFYDSNKNRINHVKHSSLISNESYYWCDNYVETEDGFEVQISKLTGGVQSTTYVAFSFRRTSIGDNPVITINEPLTYSEVGVLADTISVKSENIIGLDTRIENAIDSAIGSAIGGSY